MEDQQEQYFNFKLVQNRLGDKKKSSYQGSRGENIFENVHLA